MGVNGLWRLLMPIGRRISVETLTNKTLAIDASIWLTQFLKAMRDPNTGQTKPSAHLIGFIRRICKLLFFGIKPVFVFDGPTPEIKMREIRARRQRRERVLFGGEDIKGEDAAIKKLARRILLQQIQRSKETQKNRKQKGGTNLTFGKMVVGTTDNRRTKAAFASGFHLEEDEHDEHDEHDETKKPNESNNDIQDNNLQPNQNHKSEKIDRNVEIVNIDSDSIDEKDDDDYEKDPQPKQNDFDKPILADSDDEEESTSNANKGYRAKYRRYQPIRQDVDLPSDQSDIDEDAVLSMPNHVRTDIFETAMRKQRLRSRQEFMPVAGNPIAYSQVQLRNFLKQSHLNQKLNRIAAINPATKNEEEGDSTSYEKDQKRQKKNDFERGERIASDPSKRFIFTTDTNSTEKDKVLGFKREHTNKTKPRLKRNIETSNGSESEEDDNIFDIDNNKTSKVTFVDLEDEDSDISTGGGFLVDDVDGAKKNEVPFESSETNIQRSRDGSHDINPLSDSSDEEAGFIIDDIPTHPNNPTFLSSQKGTDEEKSIRTKQILQDEMLATAIQNSDRNAVNEGYNPSADNESVTIPNKKIITSKIGEKNSFDSEDENDFDAFDAIYSSTKKNEINQEEKEDSEKYSPDTIKNEPLLQKEKLFGFLSSFGTKQLSDSDSDIEGDDDVGVLGIVQNLDEESSDDKPIFASNKEKDIQFVKESTNDDVCATNGGRNDLDSDDESDEIHWEEGNKDDDSIGSNEENTSNAFEKYRVDGNSIQEGKPDGDILEESFQVDTSQTSKQNHDDFDDETEMAKPFQHSSIEKEYGSFDALKDSKKEKVVFYNNNDTFTFQQEGNTQEASSQFHNEEEEMEDSANEVMEIEKNESMENIPSTSNRTALLQAQRTASNLTDWAGRAVRRAFADHIDVKCGSLDVANNEKVISIDDDESSENSEEVKVLELPVKSTVVLPSPASTDSKTTDIKPSIVEHSDKEDESRKRAFINSLLEASTSKVDSLAEEEEMLNEEIKRHERDMATVTDEMKSEVIQLLQLFGIPYVESPSEAEAQCAALEELGLVDGIVTEDSDAFVFGGRTVYKNIFDDKKYVEVYRVSDAEREMALTKNSMIALAMLLGGDYTDGVKGVGIVNGMEILRAFPVGAEVGVVKGLTDFKKWLEGFDPTLDASGKSGVKLSQGSSLSKVEKFHVKHRSARTRWIAPKQFPSPSVFNAYSKPVVDKSKVKFTWGVPDLEGARSFCLKLIGWRHEETDKIIVPVLKEMAKGSRQTKLESYFMTYSDNIKFANVRSKRLQAVLKDVKDGEQAERRNNRIQDFESLSSENKIVEMQETEENDLVASDNENERTFDI